MNIVYLVQGKKSEIPLMRHYFEGRNALMLTWDEREDGCIFFPNSTWSQGRRLLLSMVIDGGYEYIAFLDGDVKIIQGSLEGFERKIEKYKPAIAVPLFDKTVHNYQNLRKYYNQGLIYDSDEQFQVFNAEVISKVFLSNPYVSRFDSISWWYPCVIVQGVVGRFLIRYSLLDLELEISNDHAGEYPNKFDGTEIHDVLFEAGINWYFPLAANEKLAGAGKIRKYFIKRLDVCLRLLSVVLFSLLRRDCSYLKAQDIACVRKLFRD